MTAHLWRTVTRHGGVGVFSLLSFFPQWEGLEAEPLTSVFSFHSDIWHDCSSHVKELPWRILLMKRLDSATERVIWYKSQSGTFNSGLFKRNHNYCRFLKTNNITDLANTEIGRDLWVQGAGQSCTSQMFGGYIYSVLIKANPLFLFLSFFFKLNSAVICLL